MESKQVPLTSVEKPYPPQQPTTDQLYPAQQPAGQPYSPPQQPAGQPLSPQQPADQPYSPQQQANQPYPPPGYQPGYQYPGVAPVITQQPAFQQTTNTTVVVNQQAVETKRAMRNWSSGLCGCFEDCGSLCSGIFCPATLLLNVSSRMGEGCCFPCCCPGALLGLRIKLRVQENIEGSLLNDYLAVQCCPQCVLCQLARELNHIERQ